MTSNVQTELTAAEQRELRRLAGFMVPASAEYGVPGADDETIFADIVASLGRDTNDVRKALAVLSDMTDGGFTELSDAEAQAKAMLLLSREDSVTIALGRAVLQCYYRDDRVLRSLGLELRAPFPKGYTLEQGDWALLDPVKKRSGTLRRPR
jgi:hypothetical protein